MKSKVIILILAIWCLMVTSAQASEFGFIEGNIWFSKSNFFSGETIRIYSAVFNRGTTNVSGQVEFYDNDLKIGTAEFSGLQSGLLKEVKIDWQATEGNHVFSAKIVGSAESTGTSARLIDTDTDHDGLGNLTDNDDDNDGVMDAIDPEPLIVGAPNTPTPVPNSNQSQSQDTGTGFVAQAQETIDKSVSTYAEKTSATLKEIKVDLEKEIVALNAQEIATEQTVVGDQINQAVENSNFVPETRSTGTPSQTLLRIFKQLLLFLVNISIYILEHKVFLYITLAIIALFLLRLLWRMFGRQQL
jgi:hypothetical protein